MRQRPRERDVRFEVVDGDLVRTVTFADGRSYAHRSTRKAFEAVAHALAEMPAQGEGATTETLAKGEDLPFSQACVALEFLKERGCVVTRGRRTYPASDILFEDAMAELLALAEGVQDADENRRQQE